MSWWSTSWLPTLPSIDFSLPAGIQKRFISFALRQALGHLLKPGQLDTQQVDSQIGSGFVQVRDVELDNDAINSLISGLPIQLHDGSVGKVTARIPWPNPLTSTLGLSLDGLHLTFNLCPTVTKEGPIDLAESVASVAETFLHEELDAREEAVLRESIHLEIGASNGSLDHIPGGINPFLTNEEASTEANPPGVSIFATLVERLLSRFELDATDIRITLVNPGDVSFTLLVPSVRYGTEHRGMDTTSPSTSSQPIDIQVPVAGGAKRILTVSGVTVTTRSLRPPNPKLLTTSSLSDVTQGAHITHSPPPTIPLESPPRSPALSDSDMDEEAYMQMSQARIVDFPARPSSPASSVASSMYQSAASYGTPPVELPTSQLDRVNTSPPPASQTPFSSPPQTSEAASTDHTDKEDTNDDIQDETIISFGSEPIVFCLVTPPLRKTPNRNSNAMPPRAPAGTNTEKGKENTRDLVGSSDSIRIDVGIGVIAFALRARHVCSLARVAQLWASHASPPAAPKAHEPSETPSSSIFDRLEASIQVRGIVFLLLPAKGQSLNHPDDPLAEYFSRPMIPPHLPHGFVRIHLDGISIRMALRPTSHPSGSRSRRSLPPSKTISLTLHLSDLSAFVFLAHKNTSGLTELSTSPILIVDPNLASQYPTQHTHPDLRCVDGQMPTFDIIDWTDPARRTASAKLSAWRVRPSHGRSASNPGSPVTSPNLPFGSPPRPAPVNLPSSPGRIGLLGTALSPKVAEAVPRPQQSALTLKVTMVVPAAPGKNSRGSSSQNRLDVEVEVAPLHIFCDLGLILEGESTKSETLLFVGELSSLSPSSQPASNTSTGIDSEDYGSEEDADTPPGTPQARAEFSQRNQEKERRRLEQMVLDDLDLDLDYLGDTPKKRSTTKVQSWQKKQIKPVKGGITSVSIKMPMIRIQARCKPPPSRAPRSGAIILDIHDLCLIPGEPPESASGHSARFGDPNENLFSTSDPSEQRKPGTALVSAEWARMVVATTLVGESKATVIFSAGGLQSRETSTHDYPGSPPLRMKPTTLSKQRVVVTQSSSRPSGAASSLATIAVAVDIPSVFVKLSKPHFDGLQFLADDIQQLMERTISASSQWDSDTERADSSRNTSMIGSRFFTKTRRSQESETASSFGLVSVEKASTSSETIIKITIYEAAARLLLPRQNEAYIRPFDILASDIDVLLEVKPDGQDETVVTLGVNDLNVVETSKDESSLTFLGLTIPRAMSNSVQSLLKLRFTSFTVPGTSAKETWIKVTLCGVTYSLFPNLDWTADIGLFVKAPPGVFESVVPSERTRVSLKIVDSSLRAMAPSYKGAMVLYMGEIDFSTVIVGNLPETSFDLGVQSLALLMTDDLADVVEDPGNTTRIQTSSRISRVAGVHWKVAGYALLLELSDFKFKYLQKSIQKPPAITITIDQGDLRLHLCADTGAAIGAFISDFTTLFSSPPDPNTAKEKPTREPLTMIHHVRKEDLLASVDEQAFRQTIPRVGADPEFIDDNIPRNSDYLDGFSASAGLRALDDDEEFGSDEDPEYNIRDIPNDFDVIYKHGGETIRLIDQQKLTIVENYFETLPPDSADESAQYGETTFKLRIHNGNATVVLYDGYDWSRTRRIIEEEQRDMRRRLAKIRQLVATGQTPDPSVEETSRLLFNSVYIGLEHDVDELEPAALIQAIDQELNDDFETTSLQSSWQSLKPQQVSPSSPETRPKRSKKKLTRSKGPSIEFRLMGLEVEVDNYREHKSLASRTLVTIRDAEILDHIKTSTWSKFLTSLRTDSKGNIRETGSNMVRVELRKVYPVEGNPTEEARLRAKLLPLRLHVDQDALDFLKKFFAFKDPEATPSGAIDPADEVYFQHVEVFPVDLKLDYKPRRVDYRALREGRTIELMNFFHFDGAEMTLRHITLTGVSGWARVGDLLNDLWTPDVKATQLVEVISGVAPIRSVVNVGSGVADLVLIPIAQYKKDGRVVHGLQKGTKAFVQSTATEAIKLGARLATGTQVILEQTENVLGGQFGDSITTETVQLPPESELIGDPGDMDDLISRYADQPTNVKEGVRFAYKSLKRNFNSAAQTILAVPMEVYERSGNEGAVRAVVRAVPIAVLKPMIGASEAISKTLLGLHNSLDPNVRAENELKYKKR